MSAALVLTLTAMGYTLAPSAHVQHNPADYDTAVKADPIAQAMDAARTNVTTLEDAYNDAEEARNKAPTRGGMHAAQARMDYTEARAASIRAEWAAYLYSRYCGNGSIPMPSSVMP